MVKRQVTFTADEEIQEILKDSDIPDKKQSRWINEKIKLGIQLEKNPKTLQAKSIENVVIEL